VRILVNGGLRGTTFVIARDGENGEAGAKAIDARVLAQGLGPVFRRAGRCPDMPAAYAAADLVALPDERGKIFNATAVEAHLMGRPVIAPDVDGLPEIVLPGEGDNGGTGWLVRPDDALDLARGLSAALGLDDREWLAMGVRARQEAEARFAPAQVAQATLAAYSALLDTA
jgi:glycosyltransferase involved in cell wall biosynthesis